LIALGLVALALSLLAGCAGDDETVTDTGTTTGPAETSTVRVYWLRDGKVWPVAREVDSTSDSGALISEAIDQLLLGPTDDEVSELGSSTAIASDIHELPASDASGRVSIELPSPQPEAALAQIVYTLTQFPDVRSLEIDARTLTRTDFDEYTPAILVESPLAFEEVESPLRATGTANTFEANFQYEVLDPDGEIVTQNFVTATSGNGTRGTFDFTTADFTVAEDGDVTLIVLELSAEDGSRINEVEIPLRMSEG